MTNELRTNDEPQRILLEASERIKACYPNGTRVEGAAMNANNESPTALLPDEAESLLRRAMEVCIQVMKRGEHAAHNAAVLNNAIERYLATPIRPTAPGASESRGSVPDVPRRCRHRDTAAGVRWRCDLADGHEGKHVMVGDDPDAKCMRCGERRGDHDDLTACVVAITPPAVSNEEGAFTARVVEWKGIRFGVPAQIAKSFMAALEGTNGEPPDWAIAQAVRERTNGRGHGSGTVHGSTWTCRCVACNFIIRARELARSAAAKGEG